MYLDLMKSGDNMPKIIVIDGNIALINVVVIGFPKTIALVCRCQMKDGLQRQSYGCTSGKCQRERFPRAGWEREGS
jgi:hypothetical protein